VTGPSRISRTRILEQLRLAGREGDRTALELALGEMRTLAYSPRYWQRYLELLQHPLARLADLLAIKQGERIARQKGWTTPRRSRAPAPRPDGGRAQQHAKPPPRPRRRAPRPMTQPSLFADLP
jgi:hypothetical protein